MRTARSSALRGSAGLGLRALSVFVVVGVLYAAGLEMAWGLLGAESALVFFPPAGVTLAALLILQRRLWPAVLAAITSVEIAVDVRHGFSVGLAALFALANAVEPLVGALALGRLLRVGSPIVNHLRLDRRAGMGWFVVAGLGIGPATAALIGASAQAARFPGTNWFMAATHWWAGDGLGALAVGAPIIVCWQRDLRQALRPAGEALLLLALVVVVSILTFWEWRQPLVYLLLPVLLWAAVRFDVVGVALAALVASFIANVATANRQGPFAAVEGVSRQAQLGLTKLFLAVTVLTAWAFAIASAERTRAVARESAERNARLAAERSQATGHLGASLAQAITVREMVDTIGEHLMVWFSPVAVVINELDVRTGRFRRLWAANLPDELMEKVEHWTLDMPSPGVEAIRTGRPVWAESAEEFRQRFASIEPLRARAGAEAVAALPLVASGHDRFGFLTVMWDQPRRFADAERAQLETVAQLTGQALERARLYEIERATAARLAALQNVTAALATTATVAEVNEVIVGQARAAVGAKRVELVLLDGDGGYATTGSATSEPLPPTRSEHPLVAETPIGEALRTGRPILVGSPEQLSERFPLAAGTLLAGGDQAWLSLPLRVADRLAGALVFSFGEAPAFDDDDRAFMVAVADQCSQALERARLRAAEHDAVLRLQHTLLSHTLDASESIQLVARYRPAASPLRVGGDWYDVIGLPGQRVMLIVGDVVGRGLPAALTMSQLRSAARALAPRCGPAELLHELDRYAANVEGADCTTMACLLVDPLAAQLHYSVAGHPPPILRGPEGKVELLEGGRYVPLGSTDELRPQAVATFQAGSVLVLYTDGLVERRGELIDIGLERLSAAVAAASIDEANWIDPMIDRCLAEGSQADDLAVLCARLDPVAVTLRYLLRADARQLADDRRRLRRWFDDLAVCAEDVGDVLVAVGEACTNALTHTADGGATEGGDPAGREVASVELRVDPGGRLTVSVTDHGRWQPRLLGDGRPGGRGISLMRSLMDDVDIVPSAAGTTVTMRRHVCRNRVA